MSLSCCVLLILKFSQKRFLASDNGGKLIGTTRRRLPSPFRYYQRPYRTDELPVIGRCLTFSWGPLPDERGNVLSTHLIGIFATCVPLCVSTGCACGLCAWTNFVRLIWCVYVCILGATAFSCVLGMVEVRLSCSQWARHIMQARDSMAILCSTLMLMLSILSHFFVIWRDSGFIISQQP